MRELRITLSDKDQRAIQSGKWKKVQDRIASLVPEPVKPIEEGDVVRFISNGYQYRILWVEDIEEATPRTQRLTAQRLACNSAGPAGGKVTDTVRTYMDALEDLEACYVEDPDTAA